MTNRIPNAGFLEMADDYPLGWDNDFGPPSVEESQRGAPGRAVIVGSGNPYPAVERRPQVFETELIEVSVSLASGPPSSPGTPGARLVWFNSGGAEIGQHFLAGSPAALTRHGEGVGGVRETFRRYYGRYVVPAGAVKATLAPFGGWPLVVLKPFLDAVPFGRADPLMFDPGVMIDTDLQHPVWPKSLSPFQSGSGGEPQDDRVEFGGSGAGRPASRRLAASAPRRFQGRLRCDPVQRAVLEAFHASNPGDFWIVEPDTDRLCLASFAADGAPRMGEHRGPTVMMDVGLWLETA